MLQFKIDSISERILVTITEFVSVIEPVYVFQFTHVLTKDVVIFTKTVADDFSNYQNRYNEFSINPSVLFNGFQVGEWHYKVTEQQTGYSLEYGKLLLERGTDFSFKTYNNNTTFKTYNG